jgi:hypothetical protein
MIRRGGEDGKDKEISQSRLEDGSPAVWRWKHHPNHGSYETASLLSF